MLYICMTNLAGWEQTHIVILRAWEGVYALYMWIILQNHRLDVAVFNTENIGKAFWLDRSVLCVCVSSFINDTHTKSERLMEWAPMEKEKKLMRTHVFLQGEKKNIDDTRTTHAQLIDSTHIYSCRSAVACRCRRCFLHWHVTKLSWLPRQAWFSIFVFFCFCIHSVRYYMSVYEDFCTREWYSCLILWPHAEISGSEENNLAI